MVRCLNSSLRFFFHAANFCAGGTAQSSSTAVSTAVATAVATAIARVSQRGADGPMLPDSLSDRLLDFC